MTQDHHYNITTEWTGKTAEGTKNVKKYNRTHTITNQGKPELILTTDNPHVGDKTKLNPEDLLVSSISSCHMLSYLYVCALEGIVITSYIDNTNGIMTENATGGGSFKEVTLNPVFSVAVEDMVEKAIELHHKAHEICYIANSVNFEIKCNPICKVDLK